MVYGFSRWRVAVLDENAIGLDQAFIIRSGMPAELFLEGRSGLVVSFHGGDAGQCADERLDSVDQPLRRCEAGLNINDEQSLFHVDWAP